MKVVISEIKRTAIGKFLGMFADLSAPQLCSYVVKDVIKKIDVKEIDEVIIGNVLQAGVGQNPARQAAILGGIPTEVGSYTVNKVCGSGLKAVMLACQSIKAGDNNLVVAGGMESMSNAPHVVKARNVMKLGNINKKEFCGYNYNFVLVDSMVSDGLWCAFNNCHMGDLTAKIIKKYRITRKQQDEFAFNSHNKAITAIERGYFKKELVNVNGLKLDEGPRKDTTLEKLSELREVFGNGITAGNASSLNDGASVSLVCSEKKANELGLKVLAEVEAYSQSSVRPADFPIAPVSCVKNLLKKTKHKIDDFDLIELNEAFAGQSLVVVKELSIERDRLNVNGGAIALGHPIGASGARILCTLIHALREGELGLATLCIGGGESVAMSVRRV